MADRPPPDEEQISCVREYASQLEYAFRTRPPPGTDGRVLAVAQFEYLPPFAIACIWENNRRARADEPDFDLELIRDAYDPAHPAYHSGQGHLIYKPAYNGPFAAIPEDQLRNVWWSQHQVSGGNIGGGSHDGGTDAGVDGEQQGEPGAAEDHEAHADEDMRRDTEEAEEDMEGDAGDAEADKEMETGSKHASRSTTAQSDGAIRGRSTSTRKNNTSAPKTRRTTRSASRPRTAPGAGIMPPSLGPRVPPQSAKARGKRKAGEQDATSGAADMAATPLTDAAGAETTRANAKGKKTPRGQAERRARGTGTWTLMDITPEDIPLEEVRHPRPCQQCTRKGLACMYNPLLRSGCSHCDYTRSKCTLAFVKKSDHCLATYLGYASYRMISAPEIYAEPDFSPSQWPTPPPDKQDIAWFREQYNAVPRGRPSTRHRKGKAPATQPASAAQHDAPDDDAEGEGAQSVPALPASDDQGPLEHHSGGMASVAKATSRIGSAGPSRASSTLPGSSAESIHDQPASPPPFSAASASEAAPVSEGGETEYSRSPPPRSETSTAAMSVDIHDVLRHDTFRTGANEQEDFRDAVDKVPIGTDAQARPSGSLYDDAGGSNRSKPIDVLRPVQVKEISASSMPDEFSRRSSARLIGHPPDLPAPPSGATKYVKVPFAIKQIQETWEHLPRLGPRLEHGVYALVGPPHEDNTAILLCQLLEAGREGLEVVDRLDASTAPPLPRSASRPVTPDRHQFVFADNVIRLAQDTKAKFQEITNLGAQIQADCSMLKARAGGVMARHAPSVSQFPDAGRIIAEDVRDAYVALGSVHEVLLRFTSVFSSIPAVPWNWLALLELLTKVDELRDLYRVAWERFDVLEEDMRPVRGEIYWLRHNIAHVQACLDGIANDTVHACEPLLHNFFDHFSTRLQTIEQRISRLDGGSPAPVGPPEATIGQVLQIVTSLSARLDDLERAAGERLTTRIEGTITNYLAERGLTDEVLLQLGVDFRDPPREVEVGGSVSEVLHKAYNPPSTGGSIPPPPGSTDRLKTPLDRLATTALGAGPSNSGAAGTTRLATASAPPARQTRQYGRQRGDAPSGSTRGARGT
ncbi:hypothetical protein LXA43DRAFT_1099224 [Ganoderma leucocontextum]|nr:hypothetical protein LXA43DRAFT_1099224 [Ganoderma leucocontextum]